MRTAELRESIAAAVAYEAAAGELQAVLAQRLGELRTRLLLPEEQPVSAMLTFITRYIRSVPGCLRLVAAVSRRQGFFEYAAPYIHLAEDFFLQPPTVLTGTGLAALLDEAFLAHRLLEEVNDHHHRRLDQVRSVRDCILGTSIFGTARTVGDVRYALLPADDSVRLAVYLTGEAHSSNRGYNGPVRINTQGYTTYAASSYITIRDDAFTASPAVATANTHTNIRSIQKTGGQFAAGLITKIAWRRAGEQKRQAEHIEEGYRERGVPEEEADSRAWATVTKMTGGGKNPGSSGLGQKVNKGPAKKGGRIGGARASSRSAAERAASAKKAARTRARIKAAAKKGAS